MYRATGVWLLFRGVIPLTYESDQPDGRALDRPASGKIAMNAVAWQAAPELDLAEWLHQGKRLGSIGRGSSWWIGDWINYGNTRFGEKYSRAAQITGYDAQSLMNMAYVAARFEISRRRENLSWSHHAEVAGLPPQARDRWLEHAEINRISVRGLREQLRAWRAQNKGAEPPEGSGGTDDPVDPDSSAKCPRCGYELQADYQEPDAVEDHAGPRHAPEHAPEDTEWATT
jgi:hypothetical protein